jgi:2'-deoxynucleoside 5'-phosphate N-hydrolase
MKIYFAGAIRGGREDSAIYLDIVSVLTQYGTVLTEHVGDPNLDIRGEELSDQQIYDRDLEWLRSCDCLVAEVTKPSLGVGFEIGKATEWGIQVLCLYRPSESRSLSAMIAGCDKVTVETYRSVDELDAIFARHLSR